MAIEYYAISLYAGNIRTDGRRGGQKPAALVHGIGSKRAMHDLAQALDKETGYSQHVVWEVLPCQVAEARYGLTV